MDISNAAKQLYIRNFNLKRDRYEPTYVSMFRKALRIQQNEFYKAFEQTSDIGRLITIAENLTVSKKPIEVSFKALYSRVGSDFGKDQLTVLNAMKKDPIDEWLYEQMINYVDEFSGDRITLITDTTKEKMVNTVKKSVTRGYEEGLAYQSIVKDIKALSVNITTYRAVRIARTELMAASCAGSQIVAQDAQNSGLVRLKKEWYMVSDAETRETHQKSNINPNPIPLNDKFIIGTDSMMQPGDNASAGNVINCRCCLIYTPY